MWIAHVDMDCFFAACEQKYRPELATRPVVIGGGERGVVCTANYLARKLGVSSGMPMSIAKRKARCATFIIPNHGLYAQESQLVMQTLADLGLPYRQVSIDEAYIDISTGVNSNTDAFSFAKRLRKNIFAKTGYTCSVGVGKHEAVAKIASGYTKPHGVTVVYNATNFLAPLPLVKIPGIGQTLCAKFAQRGLYTIGDIVTCNRFVLLDCAGSYTSSLIKIALGCEQETFMPAQKEQSFSVEETLPEDVLGCTELISIIAEHTQSAFNLARAQKRFFQTVTIKLKFSDFSVITRSQKLSTPIQDKEHLWSCVKSLVLSHYQHRPVRLVGVKLSDLHDTNQSTLAGFLENSSIVHCQ